MWAGGADQGVIGHIEAAKVATENRAGFAASRVPKVEFDQENENCVPSGLDATAAHPGRCQNILYSRMTLRSGPLRIASPITSNTVGAPAAFFGYLGEGQRK